MQRLIRRYLGVSACLLAGALAAAPASAADDRWVMTLSWSPQYCEQHKASTEPQCTGEFYLVNFGLQAARKVGDAALGDSCPNVELPVTEEDRWMWTVPNRQRIRYIWYQQGACTELGLAAYYAKMDYASRRVELPPEFAGIERRASLRSADVKASFLAMNANMSDDSIELECEARWLSEVHVCFDAEMQFVQCPKKGNCPEQIWLRPLRPDRKGAGTEIFR
jgi:ribonuclease T2